MLIHSSKVPAHLREFFAPDEEAGNRVGIRNSHPT